MKLGLSLLISDTMDFKKTHKPEKRRNVKHTERYTHCITEF